MYLPEQVKKIIDTLNAAGHEAYAVGGCVRDGLLGRAPGDYDVASSALPEETKAVFAGEKLIETGLRHGTVTVLSGGIPVEVTTFRIDGEYADCRHPDSVTFTRSLRDDLARRDFTVNAMAYSPEGGIIDLFGGRNDLDAGLIRCVGDADARFKEDALRIIRALRFASVLGFQLEEKTARAARDNKELLKSVSAERLFAELLRLLCGQNVRAVLCGYIDVIGAVIPEALPMKGFLQRNPHHIYDVLEHTAAAVEAVSPEPELRLAALLHDIGKPRCLTVDDAGTGHFYGHAEISAEIAEDILSRLKSDGATRKNVVRLVREHGVQIEENERAVKRALNRLGEETFFRLLQLKRADNAAQSPENAGRRVYYDGLERLARQIIEKKQCFSLKNLAVNGDDLIALGIRPGPELGVRLNALLEAVISGKAENSREALLCLADSDAVRLGKSGDGGYRNGNG